MPFAAFSEHHRLLSQPDLVQRDLKPSEPNQTWASDITYVWTDEGWAYLAVVLDLYSRKFVGWALADHTRAELVLDALDRALATREIDAELVHHSDRGSQYASAKFCECLDKVGVQWSMGATGCCCDNAVVESFFATSRKTWFIEPRGAHETPLIPRSAPTSTCSTAHADGIRRAASLTQSHSRLDYTATRKRLSRAIRVFTFPGNSTDLGCSLVSRSSKRGWAERETALTLVEREIPGKHRFELGADKGYDTKDFVKDCRRVAKRNL